MAKAYQCDRCKKCYTHNSKFTARSKRVITGITIDSRDDHEDIYDFCDDCLKELMDWFNKEEN